MKKDKKLTYISEEPEETGKQTKKLKKQLKQCQKEKEGHLTQLQRARADLINFRKRQEQIMEEIKNYGQVNFIRELLPVLDSLRIGSVNNMGVTKIKEQLEVILAKYGLKEIKAEGERFNPEFHEAIEQIESEQGKGTIAEEAQKGYMLGDKIVRPSKVKVAK